MSAYGNNPLANIPPVVKNLLIINILMLIISYILSGMGIDLWQILGLHYIGADSFKPYQFISHIFMHAGFTHLFFNMFALWMFGRMLEMVWGPKRFFIYYMVTGIGAAVLHTLVLWFEINPALEIINNPPADIDPLQIQTARANINAMVTVGASGAVFGILLAFGMLFPNTQLMLIFPPIPIKAKYFVIFYGVLELFLGIASFSGDNVAHFAHLGGMLFGFVMIKMWQKDRNNFY